MNNTSLYEHNNSLIEAKYQTRGLECQKIKRLDYFWLKDEFKRSMEELTLSDIWSDEVDETKNANLRIVK